MRLLGKLENKNGEFVYEDASIMNKTNNKEEQEFVNNIIANQVEDYYRNNPNFVDINLKGHRLATELMAEEFQRILQLVKSMDNRED